MSVPFCLILTPFQHRWRKQLPWIQWALEGPLAIIKVLNDTGPDTEQVLEGQSPRQWSFILVQIPFKVLAHFGDLGEAAEQPNNSKTGIRIQVLGVSFLLLCILKKIEKLSLKYTKLQFLCLIYLKRTT